MFWGAVRIMYMLAKKRVFLRFGSATSQGISLHAWKRLNPFKQSIKD